MKRTSCFQYIITTKKFGEEIFRERVFSVFYLESYQRDPNTFIEYTPIAVLKVKSL